MCVCDNSTTPNGKRVTFDVEYVVYGTMSCGYTVKMCDHLKRTGKSFEFVDVSEQTTLYQNVLNKFGVKSSGVPFVVHKPSDTYFIGFRKV